MGGFNVEVKPEDMMVMFRLMGIRDGVVELKRLPWVGAATIAWSSMFISSIIATLVGSQPCRPFLLLF